jgi:hypothetical protein
MILITRMQIEKGSRSSRLCGSIWKLKMCTINIASGSYGLSLMVNYMLRKVPIEKEHGGLSTTLMDGLVDLIWLKI